MVEQENKVDEVNYKNIQLPEDLHKHIKTLAAAEGVSMISFLARETGYYVGVKK